MKESADGLDSYRCKRGLSPIVSFSPRGAVQAAVAYGFGYVLGFDGPGTVHIGNGTGYFQYSVIGSGRQVEPVHGRPAYGWLKVRPLHTYAVGANPFGNCSKRPFHRQILLLALVLL